MKEYNPEQQRAKINWTGFSDAEDTWEPIGEIPIRIVEGFLEENPHMELQYWLCILTSLGLQIFPIKSWMHPPFARI